MTMPVLLLSPQPSGQLRIHHHHIRYAVEVSRVDFLADQAVCTQSWFLPGSGPLRLGIFVLRKWSVRRLKRWRVAPNGVHPLHIHR